MAANRDYTSITDELELKLIVNPIIPDRAEEQSPEPLPAVQIESEQLRDAEEADYNLMERLIERRLKKEQQTGDGLTAAPKADSPREIASLDELAVKSLKAASDGEEEGIAVAAVETEAVQKAPAKEREEEEDESERFFSPVSESAPAAPPAASTGSAFSAVGGFDSLRRMQTVPAPRHKEGSVRIRLAADADIVEVEFIDEVGTPDAAGRRGSASPDA